LALSGFVGAVRRDRIRIFTDRLIREKACSALLTLLAFSIPYAVFRASTVLELL
jgi:hypothetical protein